MSRARRWTSSRRGLILRPDVPVAIGMATLSASLGLRHVHDALWQDEVASARIIDLPNIVEVLHRVRQTESTPPLWYVLAWLWHQAGLGIAEVRLVSLAASAAATFLVVVFARRMLPLALGALCGLLVAIGSEFAAHSHELRAYALLMLITVVFAIALDAEVARRSVRREAALAAVVAAGMLTHYFFSLSVVAGLVWLWCEPEARQVRRRATMAVCAGVAMFLPWLPAALAQYRQDRFWWIGPFVLRQVVNAPFQIFSAFSIRTVGELVPVLALATAAIGAVLLAHGSRRGRLTAILAVGPLLGAGLAWWVGMRVFATRNLLEMGPFLAVAFARAIAAIPKRAAVFIALCVAAAVATGYARSQRGEATPYDAIARALVVEGWRPGDPIAVYGSFFFAFRSPLEWYLPAQPPLARGRPSARPCRVLFVVRPGWTPGGTVSASVGRFTVERLAAATSIDRLLALRRFAVLADPLHPGCVRAITTGRFAAGYGLPGPH